MFNETNIFELLNDKYVLPKKVRLFESFSGIGCQRLAFNRLGIEVEMVGISEIDKYAIASYNAIHGDTKNWGSICDIKGQDLPEIDVFTYSFPCTDLSRAGSMKGLSKDTRSGLVYQVLRILHELKEVDRLPKCLIMENVVDLVQVKFIRQFQAIQLELEGLGYSNYAQTLNAKDFGVAQNRDRIFMVSVLGDKYYEFPKPIKLEKRLKDYLEFKVEEKYYLSNVALSGISNALERNGKTLDGEIGKEELSVIQYPSGENAGGLISNITSPTIDGAIGSRNTALLCLREDSVIRLGGLHDDENGTHQAGSIYDKNGISPTIDTAQGGQRQPHIIEQTGISLKNQGKEYVKDIDVAMTLMARDYKGFGNQPMNAVQEHFVVKENNEKCFDIAIDGDCININQPNSKTRSGRVGHQISQTLTTVQELVVVEPNAKEALCNKMLESGQLKEFDMIRHSYTEDRLNDQDVRIENQKDLSATMTTRPDTLGVVVNNQGLRIRKLTPKECWRLMGIDDDEFDKASKVVSNSQLYKQAGNGIVVDVFAAILKKMVV